MKKKWWVPLITVVLVLALAAGLFWDAILIRISPKAVLSAALAKTISALQERTEGSPVLLLANGLGPEGKNTIDLDLDTSNEFLGNIHYKMNVQTENAPRRVWAEGLVTSNSSGILDLSLYLDADFAAVSSKSLLAGNYYGITYDTFSKDIRKNSLLTFLIGEETISGWEASLSELQETMGRSYEPPQFSEADIQSILVGILALKAQVSGDTVLVNGSEQKCHRITFSAPGPEIAAMAQNYTDRLSPELAALVEQLKDDPDSYVSASFYVYKDVVTKASCELSIQNTLWNASISLGANAAKDDLFLETSSREGDSLDKLSLSVSTVYDEVTYDEKLELVQIQNGIQDRTMLDYVWNQENGDMQLHLTQGGEDTALSLNLQGTEEGFRLSTDQFETLLGTLTGQKKAGSSTCTMTVTKGASIKTPAYKSFDQWSPDDLLTLLEGLGSLFGLKIG